MIFEEIAEERKEARYNELYEKANKKFQDAKNEFEQEKSRWRKTVTRCQKMKLILQNKN